MNPLCFFALKEKIFIIIICFLLLKIVTGDANCSRGSYLEGTVCRLCPKGRYGSSIGLTSYLCTAACPTGRYNDLFGAKTIDDCKLCPRGRYGSTTGLTTNKCTGSCPTGRYSSTFGLSAISSCLACPINYYEWQCNDMSSQYQGDIVYPRGKQQF